LGSVSARDVDVALDFVLDKAASGGAYVSAVARRVGSSEYRFRVRVLPSGISRHLMRVVNGVETNLVSQDVATTVVPGTPVHVRFRVSGSGSSVLQGRVWFGGEVEPSGWQIQASDSTVGLQQAGGVGVHGYLSSSAAAVAPVTLTVDNLLTSTVV
jgi:hypothetical protein